MVNKQMCVRINFLFFLLLFNILKNAKTNIQKNILDIGEQTL